MSSCLHHPLEFPQRAVELARQGTTAVSKTAEDLGVSDSCPRNWMHQSDADENGTPARRECRRGRPGGR